MKNENSYVYRPGKLSLGLSGMTVPYPDTKKVNENLVKQNILLLCYLKSKTIDELSDLTGIPKPYLEYDLEWLINREFLSLDGKKYSTVIPIIGKKHRQNIGELYKKTRPEYIDKIIAYLFNNENEIRKIGFYGSNFETKKLMWSVIMMFLSYFSRNSKIVVKYKEIDNRPIRPDGGRYYVVGNDLSDNQELNPNGYSDPKGWNWSNFYGIYSDSCITNGEYDTYYWLGIYNFTALEYHPQIIKENNKTAQKIWHTLFCSLIEPDFDIAKLSDDDKEKLASSIQNGLVSKSGNTYKPNFIIMSKDQLNQLQTNIFSPLLTEMTPKIENLAKIISDMHYKNMPKVCRGYINYFTYLDLWYFGIYTFTFTAQDGRLYIPPTPEEGVPLTLV